MVISECFRGLHYSAALSYNEAFREMQDRLEVKESRPGNIMTNYHGWLGFYPRAWLDLQFTNICKSHVSNSPELTTIILSQQDLQLPMMQWNYPASECALRCKRRSVAWMQCDISSLVVHHLAWIRCKKWNWAEYSGMSTVPGHIPLCYSSILPSGVIMLDD